MCRLLQPVHREVIAIAIWLEAIARRLEALIAMASNLEAMGSWGDFSPGLIAWSAVLLRPSSQAGQLVLVTPQVAASFG